jgi:N-acetylglutamate synthase and related acetyltransferases
MLIRLYTAADRQACIAAFKSNMPKFFMPDELTDFENWLGKVETTNESYFVVEQDNEVIGCGGYYIEPDKQTARMTWGLVHNSLHKKGIGKALILHRIAAIKAIAPQCIIGLDTTQHSYTFFEKLGFVTTKITPDSYGEGMHRYDMELNPA